MNLIKRAAKREALKALIDSLGRFSESSAAQAAGTIGAVVILDKVHKEKGRKDE